MKERVLLAIVDLKERSPWPLHQTAYEMEELVKACNGEVAGKVMCPAHPPESATLIHKGKVQEIAALVPVLDANTVIFSHELKGRQQRELEEQLGVRVLDRTQLILDIFARRATSLEGKLQVELAQLQYRLPRLSGNYDELSRQGGGIGTSGPGETKLETDRRRIEQRVDRIKKELEDVTRSRQVKRKQRQGRHIPLISLVGYTNAGKSTLLNTLTDAHTITKDGLFTTLDSLARQCALPNRQKVVFSDTVGFMHDLPHHLIEAFKATLEEVESADLLLHVLDVSNPEYENFKTSVDHVLEQIGAHQKPTIMVLNKIDQVSDKNILVEAARKFKNTVEISASTQLNIGALLSLVEDHLAEQVAEIDVTVPMDRMDLVRLAHQEGDVILEEYGADGIHLQARVPAHRADLFTSHEKKPKHS
ncbi:MAG: GTPase HflX [Candidatus Omnitrophota bacterium]